MSRLAGRDPLSIAPGGIGTGAAQVFDFEAFDPLDKVAKAAVIERERKAKAQAKVQKDYQDKINLFRKELDGWQDRDREVLTKVADDIINEGAKLVAKGIDPETVPDYVKQREWARGLGKKSIQDKQFYDNAIKLATEKSKQVDVYNQEDIDADLQGLEQFATSPLMERQQFMPSLKMKEKPYDIMGALKKIDIGYITEKDMKDDGTGEKIKSVKQKGLLEQAKGLVDSDPMFYKEGLKLGLWQNKEGAADWAFTQKLYQADTSREDIYRSTAKNNVFGSGASDKEIEEDFNKWKQDLKNGDENAASFLFNVQLPSGSRLEGFKVVPTVEQEQGYAAKGFAPRVKYLFNGTFKSGKDIQTIPNELVLEPLIDDDTKLYKLYISAVKDKNRTYGQKVSERKSNTSVIQDKPKPSSAQFKGVPKGGF